MKFKMAATAGLSLTLNSIMENVSKRSFSETTRTVETKLPRNDHWQVLYNFFVFLCRSEIQDGRHQRKFVEDHPMNIHVQFGFNNICSF
jgi:hypothetical protein